MGNTHSHSVQLSPPPSPKRRPFEKKRSAIFPRLALGCTSAQSTDSLAVSHDSSKVSNEKYTIVDHHHRPPSPVYPLAYSPSQTNLAADEETAFANFVKQHPGKYLTELAVFVAQCIYHLFQSTN